MAKTQELIHKVNKSMYDLMTTIGVIAPVDVLMRIGVLTKENYEKWRNGKIDYLERVCTCNLKKLSLIMKEMRAFATKNNLKPSWTYYRGWAKAKDIKLRFSKSGDENIEKAYATSFVSHQTIERLKAEKAEKI